MFEPTITCTTCQTVIPLTATLARPFIEAERKKMEEEARDRAAAFEKRETEIAQGKRELRDAQQQVQRERESIDTAIQSRLNDEREAIRVAAVEKAARDFKLQLDHASEENRNQRERIAHLESAELEFRTKRVELEQERRQLELTLARRLDGEREKIRAHVVQEQREQYRLESEVKDRTLAELNARLLEAQQAECAIREERQALANEKQALELEIVRTLDREREEIRQQAIEEQQQHFRLESEAKDQVLADLNAKLLDAQQAEIAIRVERKALEAEKQAMELEVARRLDEERRLIRETTRKEDDEQHRFKLAEKDKVIDDMRKQVDELRRKSEQGSQQLQGEVQELELEAVLRRVFPRDEIEPVAIGRSGSDVLHRVVGPNGLACGTILWESKRTKDFNDAWLAKNRDDQRAVGAQLGVVVTATLPRDVEGFDRKDGVWVVGFSHAAALGRALRQLLIETTLARVSGQDREGKSNRVYSYVTGQDFRQRVGAIVDAYISLREEIETEKRTHKTRWARQERNLELLLDGAGRLYGDLQGIVGKSMPEIEGLEAPLIEASVDTGEEFGVHALASGN